MYTFYLIAYYIPLSCSKLCVIPTEALPNEFSFLNYCILVVSNFRMKTRRRSRDLQSSREISPFSPRRELVQ